MLSHHLNAHAWALLRDVDRLLDARDRMSVSPLGAGALAGTSLADRSVVRRRANSGFDRVFANSLDAVSDRDFVAETLFDIALLGVHLSRMGEELVLVDDGGVQLRGLERRVHDRFVDVAPEEEQ